MRYAYIKIDYRYIRFRFKNQAHAKSFVREDAYCFPTELMTRRNTPQELATPFSPDFESRREDIASRFAQSTNALDVSLIDLIVHGLSRREMGLLSARFVACQVLPSSRTLKELEARCSTRGKLRAVLLHPGSEDGMSSFPVIWHSHSGLGCSVARLTTDESNQETWFDRLWSAEQCFQCEKIVVIQYIKQCTCTWAVNVRWGLVSRGQLLDTRELKPQCTHLHG